MGLIELLVQDRSGSIDEVDRLLECAKTRLADDFFNLSEAIKLQLRRPGLDNATRTELQRELVAIHVRQATASEGTSECTTSRQLPNLRATSACQISGWK